MGIGETCTVHHIKAADPSGVSDLDKGDPFVGHTAADHKGKFLADTGIVVFGDDHAVWRTAQ